MKCITKTERTLLAEIRALKRQYAKSPSPALKAEIKQTSAALHEAHAAAEAAMKQLTES